MQIILLISHQFCQMKRQSQSVNSTMSERDFASPELISQKCTLDLFGENEFIEKERSNLEIRVNAADSIFCFSCPISQRCGGWRLDHFDISHDKDRTLIHWSPSEYSFLPLLAAKIRRKPISLSDYSTSLSTKSNHPKPQSLITQIPHLSTMSTATVNSCLVS